MTLTDFLLARIAEDELAANNATVKVSWEPRWLTVPGSMPIPQSNPGLTFAPARVLAECEAKRRIVDLSTWQGEKETIRDRIFGPMADTAFQKGIEAAMKFLALPYADHPDYREEWRP